MLELFGFFAVGALTVIYGLAGMYTVAQAPDSRPLLLGNVEFYMALTILMMIDLPIRYGSCLREDSSPWGFCEWVIPRRRRK